MKKLNNKHIRIGIFRGLASFIAVLLVMMLSLTILAATERQSPDVLIVQTNLSGTVSAIQDDPDGPDGSWLTALVNVATTVRVSFPTPTSDPTTGAGVQEFRILFRKTATNNGKTDDTYTIHLYENGVQKQATIASGGNVPTTGVVVSATWDASNLATSDGSLVELYVTTTPEASGSPGGRGSIEVGAVEWNVDYTVTPVISNTPSTWDVNSPNPVEVNTTYLTGLTHFTLTNSSGYAINVSISGEDMTGTGETWTLSNDGSNSVAGTYGLMAGLSLTSYDIVVKRDAAYNNLVTNMPQSSTQDWGLQLLTPTSFGDGTLKSGNVTLTATAY